MKIILFLIAMFVFSATGFSQTKKIAHRSHSGKNISFSINSPDNFGETPAMVEARKKRDAEKMKADSIAMRAVADSVAKLKNGYKVKTKTKNKDGVITVVRDTVSKRW